MLDTWMNVYPVFFTQLLCGSDDLIYGKVFCVCVCLETVHDPQSLRSAGCVISLMSPKANLSDTKRRGHEKTKLLALALWAPIHQGTGPTTSSLWGGWFLQQHWGSQIWRRLCSSPQKPRSAPQPRHTMNNWVEDFMQTQGQSTGVGLGLWLIEWASPEIISVQWG